MRSLVRNKLEIRLIIIGHTKQLILLLEFIRIIIKQSERDGVDFLLELPSSEKKTKRMQETHAPDIIELGHY